ncbi:hypothetical protein AB2T90_11975 [Clostridium butyricum]|uniref:hypothetical protein n=1 Tax=Clostridium butyricum TaxID=1492 RepID=UPI0034670C69
MVESENNISKLVQQIEDLNNELVIQEANHRKEKESLENRIQTISNDYLDMKEKAKYYQQYSETLKINLVNKLKELDNYIKVDTTNNIEYDDLGDTTYTDEVYEAWNKGCEDYVID